MKRRLAFSVALGLALFIFLPVFISAEDNAADEILDGFTEILPPESGISLDEDLSESLGFESVSDAIIGAVLGEWESAISFFMLLMGFAVVIAVSDGGWMGDNPLLKRNVSAATLAIASVSLFSSLYPVIASVRDGLSSVLDFFASLIPVMTAASAATGAVSTAGIQATNMTITLTLLEKLCTGALIPLVFALFSLALASSFADGGMASLARGIKSLFTFGVGAVSTVLLGAIALQSVLSSAKDSASLRAARYAASGMIPMVGGTVSSALAALASGLAVVKGTVGVGAIVVILSLALAPLVSILLYRLALSISIIFLEFFGAEGGARCYTSFRTSLDALSAVYSLSVLILIVEIIIFIKSGVAL